MPTDIRVTGGTYSAGTAQFTNNTGGTFSVNGFKTDDVFVTGGTYSNGTAQFINNTGGTFSVSGLTTPFTGGTVSGPTSFTNGLTANTFSATTYNNLPIDIRVTGGTYSAGTAQFTNNTGGTFSVSGFKTDDVFVTGGTYSNGTAQFTNNTGGTFSLTGFSTGGGTTFTGGTVSGPTTFISGLSANTFSATTYLGLPTDIRVTGGTYSAGTAQFINNTGGTFSVSGFKTDDVFVTGGTYSNGSSVFTNNTGGTFSVTGFKTDDVFVTGGTYSAGTAQFINNTGGTFSVTGFKTDDVFVTGGTYSAGTAQFINNTGGTFSISGFSTGGGSTFTGGTVAGLTTFTGGLSANTISATTYYGDGSNLTGIGLPIIDFKGATSVAMNGSELAMDYFLIPANTFTTNDIIEISCTWTTVITSGSIVNVWFRSYTTNTPPSAASGQLLAVGPSSGASTKYYNFERKNLLFTSTSQLLVIANTAITDEAVVSTSTMGTPTFDTTVDNYIYPTMRATAGTATLRKFQIYKK